ncbi:LPS biosynthesis protein WbpP [bacterium K02(2017)]|nr:LPS biosynthesis protein WbpP [bacterium K02(2017)]
MGGSFKNIQDDLKKNPKKWLVTGVAGFIGSNLLESLLKSDQKVVGIDNFLTGKQENLDQVKANVSPAQWESFKFHENDICDYNTCLNISENVDYCLHQAALGSVPRSLDDPLTTNHINITGCLNVFMAAKEHKIKRVVYAASSSTYGDHPGLPKVEDQIGKPLSPYAVTKYVNELYADVMAKSYQMEFVGLRYFNVFGRRQDPDGAYAAVIPKWIDAMIHNKKLGIYGDGETTRDFCYVNNVVQANILAACTTKSTAVNQVYNVAVGEKTSLNQLFEMLKNLLSNDYSHLNTYSPAYSDFRKGDVLHSLADISKAKNLLDYSPTHDILTGLKEALEWYKANA